MRCGNCGTENPHGARFCRNCGQPLTSTAGQASQDATKAAADDGSKAEGAQTAGEGNVSGSGMAEGASAASAKAPKVDAAQVAAKLSSVPKKFIIGAAAAVVALIAIIFAVTSMGKTIDLNDYMTITVEGYDGYADSAWADIDWDAIEEKYSSKLKFTSEARKEYGGFLEMTNPVEIIESYISIDLDWEPQNGTGLSNGDVISYTWDIDEDVYDYVKCKLKFKDGEYEVSGLPEVGTFDAFADLIVEFYGVAPNGYAELGYDGSDMSIYDFSIDKSDGLSNGDKVTVSIDSSEIEYYASTLGKVPAELEKEYTVEGLDSYVMSLSEIDEAALEAMQKQATDVYNAKVARDWEEGETLQSLTYIGEYLLIPKETYLNSGELENHLFLVYKAQVRNNYTNDEGQIYDRVNDIYWYIRFDDLVVGADGSVSVDVTDYDTPDNRFEIDSGISAGWWSTKSWYYYGYPTLDELYKDVVTAYLDSYDHEDAVEESLAGAAAAADTASAGTPQAEGADTQSQAADAQAPSADTTGYILPNSSDTLLTRADLEGLSAEDCRIARNEIYARHGRMFDDAELQAHFDACDWYTGSIAPDDFNEDMLSDIEVANKDLITAYEEEMGYR